MSKKIFVLRTNSLVSREDATLCFDADNEINIPFPVLDQLDELSHEYTEKGKNAKKVLEYLSSFTITSLTSTGVRQKNGSILKLVKESGNNRIPSNLSLNSFDRRCLEIVKDIENENPKTPVILISRNAALRLKANSIGIKAQNFRDNLFPSLDEQYKGRIKCQTSKEKLDIFFKKGKLKIKDIYKYQKIDWHPNLFLLISDNFSKSSALARYNGKEIVKLNFLDSHPYGITPINAGQRMILEALLTDPKDAPIVIIKGGAGTGKTFLSLAVALEQTIGDEKIYSQILVSSPVETVGQERIGFLPGTVEEKFNPHLGGLKDNLRVLLNSKDSTDCSKNKKYTEKGEYFFERGIIQVQPIGFLRGRTILDTIYIIDETQNIDPDDIKSIVTRAGEGSKFIFLGDPTQIDNPNLNERNNGLVYLSEKMKDIPLAWQITLDDDESVRSKLAKIAAKIL